MRLLLALTVCLALVTCVGCGKSKPDPRDRPGFVDTSTNPTAIGVPGKTPAKPGAKTPTGVPAKR